MNMEKAPRVAKPRRKRVLRLVVPAGAVLLCVGLGCVWLDHPTGRHRPDTTPHADAVETDEPTYVETPEMITNLDAGPHRIAFAKLQCRIALGRSTDASAIKAAMPRIVDAAQTYLRVLRPEELRSGTGTYLLREALVGRVETISPTSSVQDILFKELIVQ